ncbi:DUF1501 domain-containing protein [Urbifossiella limnaea]|uniref:DUF1501 domain-containing protein n=1 Tax=Urbifossiella limnaea TaxID=2528023 RepID=A0A517XR58_9BACT|nr:DUF1501 domain-containing protein [Urbifossiella limnaea]QDU19993.1 hypothetical protein ETAA1_19360 [Urbifossiella limnaea]
MPTPTRRGALVAGASGFLGLSLADLFRAEAALGSSTSVKAVINVHLDGGPPQHDTIDPKPDAPAEVRGEFRSIATALPGVRVSELMPNVARAAGRFAFVRSLVGSAGAHDAFQCQSGFPAADLRTVGGRPALGCVVAKLRGSPADPVPAFVDVMQGRPFVRNSARPGFLGPSAAPFRPDVSALFPRELEAGMKAELAARGEHHAVRLTLADGLTLDRLDDRAALLAGIDDTRRDLDATGTMAAVDDFNRQALAVLTSGRLAAALDLGKEPARVQARYVPPPGGGERSVTSEGEAAGRKLLLARRLVEAGVRCVSVSFSDFDTHSKNFPRMRNLVPVVDHALAALVEDLADRGMLGDVAVVAWGEFGRTPRVNKDGGRDHWPEVGPALLAGGGIRGGVVVGETDRLGGKVASRPVSYQEVFATLYHCLGIPAGRTTLLDPTGRPQHLLDHADPIRELV